MLDVRRLWMLAVVMAAVAACAADATATRTGAEGTARASTDGVRAAVLTESTRFGAEGVNAVRVEYAPEDATFPNPERGWYAESETRDYAELAEEGYRLAMRYVRLDEYRSRPLPPAFLEELERDFASARGSGLKLILRFAYNRSREADAPLDVVLRHIEQLEPILTDATDVIAALQAGFIGAWGEWHSSTNELLEPRRRNAITEALLNAVPPSRMIQIRYPYEARDMFPNAFDGPNEPFDGSDASRVGVLNDCFLSSPSDGGTYVDAIDRTYAERVSRWTVTGGETCDIAGVSARSRCRVALREMEQYHWDYLNHEFYRAIIDRWRRQGCYDQVARRLGYRFALEAVTAITEVEPGGSLEATVTMANRGFGKLYNPRPLEVVLLPTDGEEAIVVPIADDARLLVPGPGERETIQVDVPLPDGIASGTYRLLLAMPDASETLRSDPRYSVRFANEGVWRADIGMNDLGVEVEVSGG